MSISEMKQLNILGLCALSVSFDTPSSHHASLLKKSLSVELMKRLA
jgi:hypothetical protein